MKTLNEEINRIKTIMGLITEDTQNKIAVLLDGTSSAGKSYTLKYLNAIPYWKSSDPNEWVVIASDDFSGMGEGEERRLKLDHPSIREWAKGNEFGIASGLVRNDEKLPQQERLDIPENPYEDEYLPGTDSRVWYMAQQFKKGDDEKVIFDDIGKDIIKYLPDVKFKHILLHTPIYMLLKNVKERNDRAKEDDKRNPEGVLKQYLKKYEATKTKPNINVGDPTTKIRKGWLEDKLKEYNISEEFTKYFINELGIIDNGVYYIKVKNEYYKPDIQLVNVGSDREVYLQSDAIQNLKGEESY